MVEFALSTAVYYQLPDQLTHWLKKAEEAPQVNSQFADALRFAVRLGHDAMVEMILDYAATRNLEWVDKQLRSERYHLEDPDLSEVRRIDTLSPYHGLYMVGIEAALFFRRDNTMQSIVEHLVAEIERSGPALSLVI
ncbi:MAG: hypothetical protein M1815_000378 [Lichina confinis]|nr:MAG: hypothetical protein M1815_000378 [Lichina confinis]